MKQIIEKNNEVARLRDTITEKDAEITKLKGDIQCMVDKAAQNHLPAYREMGEQLAAKDAEIERLRKKIKVISQYKVILGESIKDLPQDNQQLPVESEATPEELDYNAEYHPTD